MSLLDKFSAIEVKADTRISEEDRRVCQTHQAAYEKARETFASLRRKWKDFVAEQQELMSTVATESYVKERYYCMEGLSADKIRTKFEYLPELLINSIVYYFNDKYHVSVDIDEVKRVLLPEEPKHDWEKSRTAEYHKTMKTFVLRYEDIIEQIFIQLGGRTFEERAVDEIKEKCHAFAWSSYNKGEAKYEVQNETIHFTGYACYYKTYYTSSGYWVLEDGMKNVMRGLAHFETQQLEYLPRDIAFLVSHQEKQSSSYEFTYEKIKKLRMFKNNRVDVKFASKELAHQFAEQYLGLVA